WRVCVAHGGVGGLRRPERRNRSGGTIFGNGLLPRPHILLCGGRTRSFQPNFRATNTTFLTQIEAFKATSLTIGPQASGGVSCLRGLASAPTRISIDERTFAWS